MRPVLIALLAAALAPATALAGGWATVELSSTPDGATTARPWVVDIEILQHGRTPARGLEPAVFVTSRSTGATREVAAVPTGTPGVYRARVAFPRPGEYEYAIESMFGRHTYPPVRIGAGAPGAAPAQAPDDGFPWPALAASLAAGLLAAAAAAALQRRRAPAAP